MTSTELQTRYAACLRIARSFGQEHLLQFWPELNGSQRFNLIKELEALPWKTLDALIKSHVLIKPLEEIPEDLTPAYMYPKRPKAEDRTLYANAVERGKNALSSGKVAVLTVAGGQGTRLGFDGPKGTYPASPIRQKTLFRLFAETILAARRKYQTAIPWCIMTSPATHLPTQIFLESNGYFGLPEGDVLLFSQQMLPAIGPDGRMLLAEKHALALAPDGHGGSLKALVDSGTLKLLQSRGIEILSYFQVDNPLVKPFDPLFIGLHLETGSEMSTKVTPKSHDTEKVGNVVMHLGKAMVIEYSSFPDKLASARNKDGSRKFDIGSLGIHVFGLNFVDRTIAQQFKLPYHRADKKVRYVDPQGCMQEPAFPNAVKLETFIFDALPMANNPLFFEIERNEEFSPIKNASGPDSPQTCRQDQIERAARWLEAVGICVPRKEDGTFDGALEIAPLFALDREDLREKVGEIPKLKPGSSSYLGE